MYTKNLPGGGFFVFMKRLIIFANGVIPAIESTRSLIQPGDRIIAADGGTRHALALGLLPSLVIGDMDSLAASERQRLEATGVSMLQYPHDKDETDLELAFDYALREGYDEIRVAGALGGRLDQTVGNLSLLTDPRFDRLDIRFDDGVDEAFFTRRSCQVHGNPGDSVSLLPWNGEAQGVYTEGLHWPLRNETLFPDKTRGISNEMIGEVASLSLQSGLLLVTHHRLSVVLENMSVK